MKIEQALHVIAILTVTGLHAQPGSLDIGFNPNDIGFGSGTGVNSAVRAIVVQPDGKLVIGGYFAQYNTYGVSTILRTLPDGTIDTTFQLGSVPTGGIRALALQPDGRILCAGDFTSMHGQSRMGVARLNTDGTLDPTFDPGLGADAAVNAIVVQSDGRILLGGAFLNYDGVGRHGVVRVLANGDIDPTFDPGTGASNEVQCLALRPDGRILIGGYFTAFSGVGAGRLVQVDSIGTVDPTFVTSIGANANIAAIALQPDGNLLVAGGFTSFAGLNRPRLTRLLTDGSNDPGFQPGTGTNSYIACMIIQPDGRILIGGAFTQYGGASRMVIARVESNGAIDNTFDPGTGPTGISPPPSTNILALALHPDGRIQIGGSFVIYDGHGAGSICRVHPDGGYDGSFNPVTSANGMVNDIVVQPDGRLLVAGFLFAYDSTLVQRIVRLLPDGERDPSFDPGSGDANSGLVRALLQPDGRIVCAGFMSQWSGSPVGRIVRLHADGSVDSSFVPLSGANSNIFAAALQPDGRILIGGAFTEYDGQPISRIARLNSDGTLDTTFGPGMGASGTVQHLALQPDGRIIVVGSFTSFDGQPRMRIARLLTDGSLDPTFLSTASVGSDVHHVAVQPDGAILIGGTFTAVNGVSRSKIARLNPDGTLDLTFQPLSGANGGVSCIRPLSGGDLLISGNFTQYDGVDRGRVARLHADGTLDPTFGTGQGADDQVSVVTELPDGRIMIGGFLLSYDGVGRNRLARIFGGSSTGLPATPDATRCTVFPNPSSGLFTLRLPEATTVRWRVLDMQGRALLDGSDVTSGSELHIDLSDRPSGCYTLFLEHGAILDHVRLVVQ